MKIFIMILFIISTPRIGDKMTEKTEILPGQTWELILNADNPFETPDTIRVTVSEVKNGYVLLSYFIFAYKNSTLIRNERP